MDKKRVGKKAFSVLCLCGDRVWFNILKKRSYAEHELIFQAKCRHFVQNDRSFDRIFVWMKVGFAETRSGLWLSNIGLTLRKQKSLKKNGRLKPKISNFFVSHIVPQNFGEFYNNSKSLCYHYRKAWYLIDLWWCW